MNAPAARFNRILLMICILLYVIVLALFSYTNAKVDPQIGIWNTLLNALILSLPLILFFGSIFVLVTAWREHRAAGRLSPQLAAIIHWTPRIASIVIIFFITLFSLDVFGEGGTLLEQLGAFVMHSIPSLVLIGLLIFAWRRPVVGFIAFLIAGLVFLRFVIPGLDLANFVLFSGPLLLIAALYYVDWRWNQPAPALPVGIPDSN